MDRDVFANLKTLSAEQRQKLRQRLIDRKLLAPDLPIGEQSPDEASLTEKASLLGLSRHEVDLIIGSVPGGLDNIEGIHPLTPLQEGMLFHHMLARDKDPYVLRSVIRFDARSMLDQFIAAMRSVVDRHGILRSAVSWEGLSSPVQVVWRKASLIVQEVHLDPEAGMLAQQLIAHASAPRYRIDIRSAPLMRLIVTEDVAGRGWLLLHASHHLIGDRTSIELMQAELRAIVAGRGSLLPPARLFGDYASKIRSTRRESHESFFKEMLGDVSEPTAPFGLLEAVDGSEALLDARCDLDAGLVRRMREQAGRCGVGMSSMLHAAWACVLARASGRDDVVFGTVLSGRMRDPLETSDMLGMLVNTLPIRVTLGRQGVEQYVLQVHRRLSGLIEHEHAPLTLARQCSAVAPPTPLFGALLDYRRSADAAGGPHGDAGRPWEGIALLAGSERTSFPLSLTVNDRDDRIECIIQTRADQDPERMLACLLAAIERMAHALEREPGRQIGLLDVLPADETERLTVGWAGMAGGSHRFPDPCVHRLFEEQAARSPEAVCVVQGGTSVTYGALNASANRLARHLREFGVVPESRVALCVPRSIEMIVGMLAVLKAGGAYVPLDPDYPAARLHQLVRNSAPVLALSVGNVQGSVFERLGLPVVDLIADARRWAGADASDLDPVEVGVSASNIAYLIHTSGSTGMPKGVMIEHRNVVSFIRAHIELCELRATDRVLQFASCSFDNSVAEIFPALSAGAALVLRPDGPIAPDAEFGSFLRDNRVTVADLPTAFWHLWAYQVGRGECLPPPPLRIVLAGGEKAEWRYLSDWFGAPDADRRRIVNTYGLTEATVNSLVCDLDRAMVREARGLPIGRPLANSRVYILDRDWRVAPVGVTGEIHIGGHGLARGYLGQPRLTAERFIPDPFSEDGSRLYRTGDLGRWSESGRIEYLGRADSQLKIRGYRVEPGEIEAALLSDLTVRDAKVVAHGDQIVAYVVPEDGHPLHVADLRARLSTILPAYMVPGAVVCVPCLPVNTHGKIDLDAMPVPAGEAAGAGSSDEPAGPAETLIAGIWGELLRVGRIGRHDDFFDLGGHSLLAIRVVSRLRSVTGADIGIRDLFAHPTLEGFAAKLALADRRGSTPIGPADRRGPLRLSFAQERLWFLSRLDPRISAAYHLTGGLRLTGALNVDALEAALRAIVRRHEVLRTVFTSSDGTPQARIIPPEQGFSFDTVDLSRHGDRDRALGEMMERTSRLAFDLEHGPLLRAHLVKMAEDEHVLLASMHHIVADGWSMGILTSELSSLYQGFSLGKGDPLPPLRIQYADYAAWQRDEARRDGRQERLRFWVDLLAGAPALLTLPADRPRPAAQDHAGASLAFVLDETLTQGLKSLSKRHGTTLYMTLLAAYAILLTRLSGQRSVVIGSPVANRQTDEVEALIGFFANTLALHLDLSAAPSVAELLGQVRRVTLAAQEHQDVPFEQVVDALNPLRNLSHSPVFQAMLVWQNTPPGNVELDGLVLREIHPTQTTAQCDLSLMMEERSEVIAGTVVYATALFEHATVARYLASWQTILSAMVKDDAQCIDHLPLSPAGVDDRPSVPQQRSTSLASSSRGIHELFEAQADAAPDAVAVVHEARHITYGELNARANRLARHLRGRGVGPEARVALLVERSIDMIVGVLAILKAGGAYVPLDPAFPRERLAYVVDDCAPVVLLTDQSSREVASGLAARMPVIDIQADASSWAGLPESNIGCREIGLTHRHLAYVIYTSGSTGRPKGVLVEHSNVLTLFSALEDAMRFDSGDVWTLFHSIAFDFSVWELFGALLHGGRLVVVPQRMTRLPDEFYRLICREGVTVLSQTPGAFRQLQAVRAVDEAEHRLRHVVFGGEQLDARGLAPWYERNRERVTQLTDMYGITEGTVHMTWRYLSADDTRAGARSSVGHPIPGRAIYILDEHLQPVPPGVTGEIHIAGAGVARGYLGKPQLSADLFLPDPFSAEPGARMYRTGDWGRVHANGEIEYLGRRDHQVKIRGFRIELGEIEAQLAQHPAVEAAVVLARPVGSDDVRLIAYYAVRHTGGLDEETPDAEQLRRYLGRRLPGYMVPAAYVRQDAWPLTLNGKIDREALPLPADEDGSARSHVPPAGEMETWLAGVWGEVLGLGRIGRHDNFFDLGGHSLLIAKVIARINLEFGLEMPMSELFEAPTLLSLAERVIEARLAQFDPDDLRRIAEQQ